MHTQYNTAVDNRMKTASTDRKITCLVATCSRFNWVTWWW